jgi:hypothetical protein
VDSKTLGEAEVWLNGLTLFVAAKDSDQFELAASLKTSVAATKP